ncbi:MAG TPA: phenylalanine--tRNA ligase subunit beta [Candidatus Nanoarchaeia archaeon]|nr:phenylalanine--tRNA ligase subunit beta [Candidatus Nanoarchaeia archaeon]
MPTINFSLKDLQNLVGKKLAVSQIEEYASFAKGDFEGYDNETDEIKIDFGDTNLPYLWSVEGFAIFLKGILEVERGLPKLNSRSGNYKIIVDKSVSSVRPYAAGFVAKGHKIDDYLIKQMIQLQEKVCDNFGRKRRKIAIGVYSYDKITWPVHYKAVEPESVKFVPLEFKREMSLGEILESHPKGKDYAFILEGFKKYPVLVDSKNEVLSFPPIINSNFSGKIEIGDEHLFVEATGTDLEALQQALNIFAFALQFRGFEILSVDIQYPDRTIKSPHEFNESINVDLKQVHSILGLELSEAEMKKCLERMRYGYKNGKAFIPDYRRDIMHPVDVIEDIAIGYGYMNLKPLPLTGYTAGGELDIIPFIDKIRDIVSGAGYQEVFSPVLSNKELLCSRMNTKDSGTVEISEYMSESFSVVRSWILPILMDVLSKNRHVEYPQKIFEQGLATERAGSEITDSEKIAIASAHHKAGYTEIRQILDMTARALGVSFEISETEHDSFLAGRVAVASFRGKKIAILGEIHPKVLENFGIEVPVVAMEMDLSNLFALVKPS